MAKNEYAKRRIAEKNFLLEIGMDAGFQKCWDLIQIALRDPKAVGKDIFGRGRIEQLYKVLHEYERDLGKAWLPSKEKEADVKQRDLDARLREIWGDELCDFKGRYPYIKAIDYSKSRKEWRE